MKKYPSLHPQFKMPKSHSPHLGYTPDVSQAADRLRNVHVGDIGQSDNRNGSRKDWHTWSLEIHG